MDRRPPQLPNLPPRPNQPGQPSRLQLPPQQLPSLDRSAPPVPAAPQQQVQLTGPQRLDSAEAKLAVQKAMVNDIKPVRISAILPCSVAPCLNYTNMAQVSFDLTFMQYRFSPICPVCMKNPRP